MLEVIGIAIGVCVVAMLVMAVVAMGFTLYKLIKSGWDI